MRSKNVWPGKLKCFKNLHGYKIKIKTKKHNLPSRIHQIIFINARMLIRLKPRTKSYGNHSSQLELDLSLIHSLIHEIHYQRYSQNVQSILITSEEWALAKINKIFSKGFQPNKNRYRKETWAEIADNDWIWKLIGNISVFQSNLWWNTCATNARFKFADPSTISFGLKYRLQSILSAWSSTNLALSVGSFISNVAGLQCSGARTLSRYVYALPSCKCMNKDINKNITHANLTKVCDTIRITTLVVAEKLHSC